LIRAADPLQIPIGVKAGRTHPAEGFHKGFSLAVLFDVIANFLRFSFVAYQTCKNLTTLFRLI
jgi:hypothetical protein